MTIDIHAEAEQIRAAGGSELREARDPVNLPMIENWVEAIGDTNPIYVSDEAAVAAGHPGAVAPPAMIQVWTMRGLHGVRTEDDPLGQMVELLDRAGYTSVVATNLEHTYHRYLRHGERLTVTTSLDGVVGPKRTALGEGYFFTTRNTWYSGDEPVAEMVWTILKFRPQEKPTDEIDRSATLRPVISQDSEFFWEGTKAGELRIQQCTACGELRNPPGPMCPACGADKPSYLVASGRGTIFSYVVHHAPRVPGKKLPFVVALVELEEGVRMIAELVDVDPATVTVGMPVELALTRIDDELTLPFWRPRKDAS